MSPFVKRISFSSARQIGLRRSRNSRSIPKCLNSSFCAVRDPKIVLLDEPFEGLAPVIVRDLMTACRNLAAAGQTIVVVEQNLAAALALAQRVYIINNGHIAHEGPALEIKAQPEIGPKRTFRARSVLIAGSIRARTVIAQAPTRPATSSRD
jgi:ABC-type multidrug transport system ATPase subunit